MVLNKTALPIGSEAARVAQARPPSSRALAPPPWPDPTDDVIYPESDGKPLGETGIHVNAIIEAQAILKRWLDASNNYLGVNQFVYYEKGFVRRVVAPDLFVIRGVDPHRRRIVKLWEENAGIGFALEVTSPSTARHDEGRKKALYQRLGVSEYFLFDPLIEYFNPPLHGYRLVNDDYVRIEPDVAGRLKSQFLALDLAADGDILTFWDPVEQRFRGDNGFEEVRKTQEIRLRADLEAKGRHVAEARAQLAEARALTAEARSQTAEAHAQTAEEVIALLRAENERLRGGAD